MINEFAKINHNNLSIIISYKSIIQYTLCIIFPLIIAYEQIFNLNIEIYFRSRYKILSIFITREILKKKRHRIILL